MSIEDKCHKLAEEVVAGLNIRSVRIRDEVTSDLANSIESEIDDALDLAGYRIEDYEEGVGAGSEGREPISFLRRVLGLA